MLLLDEFANLGRLDELDEISKALGLAACRTEALRLNAESDFAVAGFRLALDRTLIPV